MISPVSPQVSSSAASGLRPVPASAARGRLRPTRLAASVAVALLGVAAPVSNANIQEFIDSVGAQYNVTPAGVYEGSTMNVATGGGFVYRTPNKQFRPFHIAPPSLKSGCGGIDLFLGSVGLPSKAEFVNFVRSIGTAMPGLAFQLALSSLSPEFEAQLTSFRNMLQRYTQSSVDSCKAAEMLLDETGVGGAIKSSSTAAGNWLRTSLQATDATDAQQTAGADWTKIHQWFGSKTPAERRGVAADGTVGPANRTGPQINLMWSVLNSGSAASNYTTEDKQLLMNMVDFPIYRSVTGTNPEADPDDRPAPITHERKLGLMQFLGTASDTPNTPTTVTIWNCNNTEDCLVATPQSHSFVPFAQRVYDAARRVQTGILTRSNSTTQADLFLVANTSSVPLLRLINATTFQRFAGFSQDVVRVYSELAAFDLTVAYVTEAFAIIDARIASAKQDSTPFPTVKMLEDLRERLQITRQEVHEQRKTMAERVSKLGETVKMIEHIENASRGSLSADLRTNLQFVASR